MAWTTVAVIAAETNANMAVAAAVVARNGREDLVTSRRLRLEDGQALGPQLGRDGVIIVVEVEDRSRWWHIFPVRRPLFVADSG